MSRLRSLLRHWLGIITIEELLEKEVEQLNRTTVGVAHVDTRLRYYETHSAIIQRLRDEMIREEKKRGRAAREAAAEPRVAEPVS
jgi:hypothetical protein